MAQNSGIQGKLRCSRNRNRYWGECWLRADFAARRFGAGRMVLPTSQYGWCILLEKAEHHACREVGLGCVGVLLLGLACDARKDGSEELAELILEVSNDARVEVGKAGVDIGLVFGKVRSKEVLENKGRTLILKVRTSSFSTIGLRLPEFAAPPTR